MKLAYAFAVAIIALTSGAITVDGTLKWNGASSGGDWDEPSNWVKTAGADGLTVADLLATTCRYDLTGLANGATVNNGTKNRKVGAIDMNTANVGTVTLTGEDVLLWGKPEITVASGNTLVYKIGHSLWQQTDGKDPIILLGSGVIRLEPVNTLWFYKREIQPCGSTTLVLASTKCNFENTNLLQWNNSTVKLECNVKVGHIGTFTAGCSLDLNGYVLQVCGSEEAIAADQYLTTYVGAIRGVEGSRIEWSGGEQINLTGNVTASGKFVLYDGAVKLPSSLPDDLVLSVQGNGKFIFLDSATVGAIEGATSAGGIVLPEGKTLTVKKSQDCAFGGVVSGVSDVSVDAGTLTLGSRISCEGLLSHWKFEDSAALGADSALRNWTLSGAGSASQSIDGVFGCALDFPNDGTDYRLYRDIQVGSGKFGTGNGPVTLDFWMRTTNSSGMQYVVTYGTWGDYKQIGVWLDSGSKNLVVCCLNWSFSDNVNSPVFNWPGLFDGNWHHVAVTYANRALKVYADGKNVKSSTLTGDLNINSGSLSLGNHAQESYRFNGSLDEVRIWSRALTTEEIATAAQGALPAVADVSDGVEALPAPVCHWAFDDAANPGKDSQGVADLVNNGGSEPVVVKMSGSFGMSLKSGSAMKLPAASFPAGFPVGRNPFSVSVRVMAAAGVGENANWMSWGNTSESLKSFKLFVGGGSPRPLQVSCGYGWYYAGRTLTSASTEYAWRHIVATYDGNGTGVVYCDGVPGISYPGYALDISANDLLVTCAACNIDDIQIFDVALTPAEVGVLTRSLGQTLAPTVIPAAASLQVAEGATVKVSNGYFEASALTGRGALTLLNGAQMRVADGSAFAGTLSGTGVMALKSAVPDATVSCDVIVDGAWTIADGTKPGVQTSGRVLVPTSGVLTVTNPDKTKIVDCVLAKGVQGVQATAGVDGWTSTLAVDKWRTAFSVSDDGTQFMCRTKPRIGLFLVVK